MQEACVYRPSIRRHIRPFGILVAKAGRQAMLAHVVVTAQHPEASKRCGNPDGRKPRVAGRRERPAVIHGRAHGHARRHLVVQQTAHPLPQNGLELRHTTLRRCPAYPNKYTRSGSLRGATAPPRLRRHRARRRTATSIRTLRSAIARASPRKSFPLTRRRVFGYPQSDAAGSLGRRELPRPHREASSRWRARPFATADDSSAGVGRRLECLPHLVDELLGSLPGEQQHEARARAELPAAHESSSTQTRPRPCCRARPGRPATRRPD